MVHFSKTRSTHSLTCGELLRQIREEYGLTLDEVSEATCIRQLHLESLERNVCDANLEPIYRTQFLKNYAQYLGLEPDEVQERYIKEQELYCGPQVQEHKKIEVSSSGLWVTARIVRNGIFGTVILGAFSYLFFLGYATLHPPELLVYSPQNNLSSSSDRILVSGRAQESAGVLINGQSVATEKDGSFNQEVGLGNGVNVIQVSAVKKYGKEQTIERTVIVQKDNAAL